MKTPKILMYRGSPAWLGGVHKLRLQDLSFFDHLPPFVYIYYSIKSLQKFTIFDHVPSC